MSKRIRINNGVDPVAKEFMKYSSSCINYIESLTKTIQSEYLTKRISLHSYEKQINLLSVIRLHLEHVEQVCRDSISLNLGSVVDERI
ncbi:hypothetical protein [Heyndrickxia oleronia]|uniref:hypothetical protein n=1 Tax=Heyndrickxia oleronia TaxID=38875 RepID=UPI003752A3E0